MRRDGLWRLNRGAWNVWLKLLDQLAGILGWVPPGEGNFGLGVSTSSYKGGVTIGLPVDARVVPDPETLVGYYEHELKVLAGPRRLPSAKANRTAKAKATTKGRGHSARRRRVSGSWPLVACALFARRVIQPASGPPDDSHARDRPAPRALTSRSPRSQRTGRTHPGAAQRMRDPPRCEPATYRGCSTHGHQPAEDPDDQGRDRGRHKPRADRRPPPRAIRPRHTVPRLVIPRRADRVNASTPDVPPRPPTHLTIPQIRPTIANPGEVQTMRNTAPIELRRQTSSHRPRAGRGWTRPRSTRAVMLSVCLPGNTALRAGSLPVGHCRPVKRLGALLVAICVSLALGAAAAQSASAAFPGGDGVIATDNSDGACTGSCADAGGPGDQVSTVDLQTGAATAITSPDVNAQAFAPRWSPSGQHLVFTLQISVRRPQADRE